MIKIQKLLFVASFIAVAGCKNKETEFKDPLLTNRDTTVNINDDFFNYANGGWFKAHPIPNTEKQNGIFRTIQDTIDAQVKNICETSAKKTDAKKGSNEQKIGDFYASGMDTVAIEKQGLKPLMGEMQLIEQVKDESGLLSAIAHLHTIGVASAFNFYVGQDDKNSSKYAVFFSQGGLGMGNRDYYFNTDKETAAIRAEYLKHLDAMSKLVGNDAATSAKNAATIMKLETELAKSSRKLEALRDPNKNYNKMTVQQFKASTPNIDWQTALPKFGISGADTVIVGQPEFFITLNKMVKSYPLDDWKTYLKWTLLNNYSDYLSSAVAKQNFYFYSTIMSGVTKQKPRWKRIVEQTNSYLGELIGQVYVAEYLPKGTKEKLMEIGTDIRDVFANHIKNLDWMSAVTKKKALQKLSKIIMKVGYPDKWKDLSSMNIDRVSYCGNVISGNKWAYQEMVKKFGKPVDRTEWGMYPQTYNAYYNSSNNEIVVPACNILVPGFEDRMPDDAILYGIIGGSTFGHEITHGFDDQGSQYDEFGNLNNWWTTEDLGKFKVKTKLIVKQYSKFEPLPGKFVNGDATQGENIADLGGVVMGLEAFSKKDQFKKDEKISGLTPTQRYFLGYAYAWMTQRTKAALGNQIMTDVHSPSQFRVNGPVANIAAFHKAFDIKPGSKMYQPDSLKVAIW